MIMTTDLDACPICGAKQNDEQPYPSLHLASTVYECGCEIIQAIGYDDFVFDKRCDGKPTDAHLLTKPTFCAII